MQRYVIWLISAAVALPVYGVLNALGLSQIIVLLFTFLGAMVGAVVGALVIQRRQARASTEEPPPPPDRGSGRRAR